MQQAQLAVARPKLKCVRLESLRMTKDLPVRQMRHRRNSSGSLAIFAAIHRASSHSPRLTAA
jgi:hypothetical protein